MTTEISCNPALGQIDGNIARPQDKDLTVAPIFFGGQP
jgi:hypothetical protein